MYRRDWRKSETLTALSRADFAGFMPELVIWDNSPQPSLDPAVMTELQTRFETVRTHHTPENMGLAYIYNTVSRSVADDLEQIL